MNTTWNHDDYANLTSAILPGGKNVTQDDTDYIYEDDWHEGQEYSKIALVPKAPALLSIIASYILIRECIADLKDANGASNLRHSRGRNNGGGVNSPPLVRTLLAMSVADLFFSFPWFMTTWMAPSSIESNWIMHNFGNQATCTLQGTIFSFGVVSVPMFNVMYSFFSLMMVRYGWRDHQLLKLEPWLQSAIWLTAAVIAIFPIPLGLYNASETICWFEAYPYDCESSISGCTRAQNAGAFNVAFTVFPAWLCFALSVVLMTMIHLTVRHLEERVSKYATSSICRSTTAGRDSTNGHRDSNGYSETGATTTAVGAPEAPIINRSKSEAVARRAIWLACAFLLTYSLDLIVVCLWEFARIYSAPLEVFAYLLYPLQGVMNLAIFLRGRHTMKTPEGRFARGLLCCLEGRKLCNRSNQPIEGKRESTLQESTS